MASYCGTTDCLMIFAGWTTTAGTDAAAIITEASAMTDAYLGDFDLSPPQPLAQGGTVYDYWIRKATAHIAVWLTNEALYRSQYEAGVPAWWDTHQDRAMSIFEGLRSGAHTMGSGVAVWERGIGPAVPSGTAPYGALLSNCEVTTDYYTDDTVRRVYTVQLDSTGTDAYSQTIRWKYSGGTAWEQEDVQVEPFCWTALSYGVAVTFDPSTCGTILEEGLTWTIEANPSRQRNYKGRGLTSWSRKRG